MAVFSESFLRLRQELDQSHEGRRKLIDDIRTQVRDMARQTENQLADQSRDRRAEFAGMIGQLRGEIRQQAHETRRQLADLAADLRHGGEVFGRRRPARQ